MPQVFALGRNSMNAFLLHMFYIYPIVYIVKETESMIVAACAIPLLILITGALSSDRFNSFMKPFTDMDYITSIWSRIKKRNEA
jgi:hypothetical protein